MANLEEKFKNDPLMPLRHTAEHILQGAMEVLYPSIKRVMGPPIEEGFYYDFDLETSIGEDDFEKIEAEMAKIVNLDLPMVLSQVSVEEARKIFANNQYKLDILDEIEARGEKVTLYAMGNEGDKYYYVDLCAGPHAKSTGEVKAFKLLSVAGAYYKGDEHNKMLQRIYGAAYDSQEALTKHLNMLEEAKKRDHRKLGKELDLFVFSDNVGPGLPLWTPKGTIIREELEKWAKETEEAWGYVRVATPHIAKHTLFEISGHLPYYRDDMYSPMMIDEEEYFLKGMNCPHHHMIYKSGAHSYRELPLRYAEYGTVYRYEQSGSIFGLMRVRSICQNDAHIYCTMEQAEDEFLKVLELHEMYYNTLGLTKDDYYIAFGLPDPEKSSKYHGDKAIWDKAETMMRNAVAKSGIRTVDDVGGAAFYGPKTDFNIRSSIGREFSISTNQLDLFMPIRFGLDYTAQDGSKQLAAVIHRAPLGSHERFIGFLIEHFAGAFPVWLSPVQIAVIPVSGKSLEYGQKVAQELKKAGLRVELMDRDDTMQAKIRDAQNLKIPYMMIVGDKEAQAQTVSIRLRSGETMQNIDLAEATSKIKDVYLTKSLQLW